MPVTGKNMTIWFYVYVEHIEIKTKTVNIVHFPYLDLSQNVKIRDVPYSLKSIHSFTFTYLFVYNTHDIQTFPLFIP
jgi:hypothetical protein